MVRYAFRGEGARADGAPTVTAEGFRPRQIQSVEGARRCLRELVRRERLTQEVERWCLLDDPASGWFFSACMDKEGTYGNGHCLYRINVRGLRCRPWETAGIEGAVPQRLELFLDEASLDHASTIALIWLVPGRKRELLVMSPVGPSRIDRYDAGGWTRLGPPEEPWPTAAVSRDAAGR